MAYRFKLDEPIADGISRIALEQLDIADKRLASREDDAAAVHDARRCLKRLRALLRLVRPALPPEIYRREATRLVNTGRLLAGARDQHVMQQTLLKLETSSGPLPGGASGKLMKLMANGSAAPGNGGTKERQEAITGLVQARGFFTRLGRRAMSFEHVAAGMERSYRRARRGFRDAYVTPSGDNFHEWRKAVQQHWRHLQLVSRAWPDVLGGRASEAKELSRLLGEDHDIHMLLTFASTRGDSVLSEGELDTLMKAGQTLQDDLRRQAKLRGDRLFAEKAGSMRRNVECYWAAASRLAESMPAPEAKAMRQTTVTKKRPVARRTSARQAASRGTGSGDVRRSGR